MDLGLEILTKDFMFWVKTKDKFSCLFIFFYCSLFVQKNFRKKYNPCFFNFNIFRKAINKVWEKNFCYHSWSKVNQIMFSKEGKLCFMVQILNLDYTLLPCYANEPESLCLALFCLKLLFRSPCCHEKNI